IGMSAAVQRGSRIVQIDSFERVREQVRVTLAADLPVGDDVEARILLCLDRHQGGIVLGLLEHGLRDAPELPYAHARRKAARQALSIDEPFWLRIASYQRGREQHRHPLIGLAKIGCLLPDPPRATPLPRQAPGESEHPARSAAARPGRYRPAGPQTA